MATHTPRPRLCAQLRRTRPLQVVAPLAPARINPGYTAWSSSGGSRTMFVMRCAPELYYLIHEMGHRLGLPHASIWK